MKGIGEFRVQPLGWGRNVTLNLNAERDRLVFGKLAAPKPLKSQRSVPGIYGNLPTFHRDSANNSIQIVTVRFAERVYGNNISVEIQPLDLTINHGAFCD